MEQKQELRFSDFLNEANIICDMAPVSRDEAISHLTDLLFQSEDGFDKEEAISAILERETIAPTVIAPGLALPHARLEGLPQPLVAVATSRQGIQFQADDTEPVQVIILLITPKADPGAYLRVLAAVSKALGDVRMLKRLLVCNSEKEIYGILTEGSTALPKYLSAKNVMDSNPVTLAEEDDLAKAISTFCTHHVLDIPIIDSDHDIRGIVALEDLLKLSLPEHLLWMEDLTSILNFEPFAELLRKDKETKIADFMREDYVSIAPQTPAIQLAKMFVKNDVRQIQVVDERKLLGVVNVKSFIAQLFWA